MQSYKCVPQQSWPVKIGKSSVLCVLLSTASHALAQATIIESRPVGAAAQAAAAPATASAVEIYYQVQMLQEEILELRGLVEQQAFELKRLKQQRLDDYVDLDRRLSALGQRGSGPAGGASPAGAAEVAGASASSAASTTANAGPAPADELASYRAAIDLVLKRQDFAGGAAALQKYLSDYPSASYASNAQYWLGEIYSQQKDWPQAITWFKKLLEQYPNHQKAAEAKFKLGRAMMSAGQTAEGRALVQAVANSDSAAAALARDYLSTL